MRTLFYDLIAGLSSHFHFTYADFKGMTFAEMFEFVDSLKRLNGKKADG